MHEVLPYMARGHFLILPISQPAGDVVYVTDRGLGCVVCFTRQVATSSNGEVRYSFGAQALIGQDLLHDPSGLAVIPGRGTASVWTEEADGQRAPAFDELVVTDVSHHVLVCIALGEAGQTDAAASSRTIGRPGARPGCFHRPSGVAFARSFLVVAEQRRMQVLTRQGIPLQVITPSGCGSFHGVCLSRDGERVLVTDPEVRGVHEFALTRFGAD